MNILNDTHCCGVHEIDGLSTPKVTLMEVCEDKYGDSWGEGAQQAFILFHDIAGGYGSDLCAYIIKHKLGYVVKTRPKINPNSENRIVAYLWSPDEPALKRWWKKSNPDKGHKKTDDYEDDDYYL